MSKNNNEIAADVLVKLRNLPGVSYVSGIHASTITNFTANHNPNFPIAVIKSSEMVRVFGLSVSVNSNDVGSLGCSRGCQLNMLDSSHASVFDKKPMIVPTIDMDIGTMELGDVIATYDAILGRLYCHVIMHDYPNPVTLIKDLPKPAVNDSGQMTCEDTTQVMLGEIRDLLKTLVTALVPSGSKPIPHAYTTEDIRFNPKPELKFNIPIGVSYPIIGDYSIRDVLRVPFSEEKDYIVGCILRIHIPNVTDISVVDWVGNWYRHCLSYRIVSENSDNGIVNGRMCYLAQAKQFLSPDVGDYLFLYNTVTGELTCHEVVLELNRNN